MTQSKTKLTDLTIAALRKRISSTERRLWLMREEEARREKIITYGSDTPEGLREYEIAVTFEFALTVRAKDAADAQRIVDEDEWLGYSTDPGEQIQVIESDSSATITRFAPDESTYIMREGDDRVWDIPIPDDAVIH
jgi:hypothetical protein